MSQTRTFTDAELKSAIVAELDWTPNVDSTHIGVAVNDGIVTLSGEVASYPEKRLAEEAAFRVRGVTAVAEEIVVRNHWGATNDSEIARLAAEALEHSVDVPADAVRVAVHDHIISLTGTVTWQFQRQAAERAVHHLKGVKGVDDAIVLEPVVSTGDVRAGIAAALMRNAQVEASGITVVAAPDGEVTLSGTVQSMAERRQAEQVAWSAPGVTSVVNRLRIHR
jgi:osmotically-inducible protein OsmY